MSKEYCDTLPLNAIYAAQHSVVTVLREGGVVDFHGTTLVLPPNGVRQYTPRLLPLLQGIVNGLYAAHREEGTPVNPPLLRINKRLRQYNGWYVTGKHTIELAPNPGGFNEIVLLHEIAHAVTGEGHNNRSAHGARWRKAFAALVRDVVSPEASLLLLDALDVQGRKA